MSLMGALPNACGIKRRKDFPSRHFTCPVGNGYLSHMFGHIDMVTLKTFFGDPE